jgi:hypothetical protein
MVRWDRRALRAIALAIALIALASGAAAAASATLEPAGEATFASNGPVTFEAGGISITCDVTYAGTLEAGPIGLSGGAPLGAIDDVQTGECSGSGAIAAVLGLPWQLTVAGTAGTLPSAATDLLLTLEDAQLEFSVFGGLATCLYGGDVQLAAALSGSNPYAVGAVDLEATVVRVSGPLCPVTGTAAGVLDLTPAQTLAVGGFSASPRAVRFGEVAVNTTVRRSVSLMNATEGNIAIARVRVNGSAAFVPRPREGFAVAAESMSNITVEYTPTAAGEHTAVLEFEDAEGTVVLRVSVSGRGR